MLDSRFETVGDNVRLYRPAGQPEIDLVEINNWKAWPPRLVGQPIFYPTLNEEYASMIANRWNTADTASGYIGYVTEFEVTQEVAKRYDVQVVGGAVCQELWVPAEDLEWFNDRIVGKIRVIATFETTEANSVDV